MKITKISLAVATVLFSSAAMADSWTITQSVTPGENSTVTQTDTTSSTQALNTINAAEIQIQNGSKQTVSANTGKTLTLIQDGASASSMQAGNYAISASIGDSTGTFTQEQVGDGNVALTQSASGASNVQAINAAVAVVNSSSAAVINDLTQTADTASTVVLTQKGGIGAGSVQAGNYADTSVTTATNASIDQSIDTASLTLAQGETGTALSKGLQAGNAIISGGAGGTGVQSSSLATLLKMDQINTTSSHQAVNYLGVVPN